MQLSKGFFYQRNPKDVRIFTTSEEWDWLAVLLGEARQAVVDNDIVWTFILEESENIEAVLPVVVESIIYTGDLIKQFLFGSYHCESI
jgi:hypothetical protein